MNIDDRLYWLWLSLAFGAGSRHTVRLVRYFGSARAVFEADMKTVKESGEFNDRKVVSALEDKSLDEAKAILKWCDECSVAVLTPRDARYPKALLQLRDAPMVLYMLGRLPDFNSRFSCAIVGTRDMTDYGKTASYNIGYGLAAGGAVVVSGMALGNDGMAMAGAVSAGGDTIAVMGCGIDIIYPPEHKELFRLVAKSGAVITEFPPGSPPAGNHFPVRNRIISGICQATVVIEADAQSGALITARHALYQGRDLYALPGRVGDKNSLGTNQLIKEGASVVTSAEDILEHYEFIYPHSISVEAARIPASVQDIAEDADIVMGKLHISSKGDKSHYGTGVFGGKAKKPKTKKPQGTELRDDMHTGIFPPAEKEVVSNINLDMLSKMDILIYNAMIPDMPTLPDDLTKAGFSVKDIMSSLTVLEISGAVEAGRGGYYLRRSSDIEINFPKQEG